MVNRPRFAKRRDSPSGIQGRVLSEAGFVGDGAFRRTAHAAPSFLAFLEQLARFGLSGDIVEYRKLSPGHLLDRQALPVLAEHSMIPYWRSISSKMDAG